MKPADNTPLQPELRTVSRREFAKRAAFGTAAAIAPTRLSSLAAPELTQPVADPQASPDASKLSPQSQAEADARFQAILAQYPNRFSDEQKADLKRLCFVLQPQLDQLRAWAIANSDQPGLYLKPLVEREKKSNAAPNLKSAPPAAGKTGATPGKSDGPAKPAAAAKPNPTEKP